MVGLALIMLQFYTNLNNVTPWNVTIPSNPSNFPNIVIGNIPWFFPAITMFLMALSMYIIDTRTNINTRTNLLAISIAYTALAYVEMLGSLTTVGWFATFEMISIALFFIITLFVNPGEE